MPESRPDAIPRTTRERIAGLGPHPSELARRAALAPEPRRFAPALAGPTVGVIAEVKRRSPSAGAIREDLDPATHARSYEHGGAVAISVLTDERHFGGTLDELSRLVRCEPAAVGVNSRDLGTFALDLALAERLVARVPTGVPAVAESGIETREDVERMAAAGADLVLVGTSVARRTDPEAAVRELTGIPRKGRAE